MFAFLVRGKERMENGIELSAIGNGSIERQYRASACASFLSPVPDR